jgi:hypothetical protein
MSLLGEYCWVMQEESERVCGTALPVEICHLILLKWGGLRHPTATAIRGLMSPVHEVCGFDVQVVPHHSIQRDQLVGPVAASRVDPDAMRVTLITNSHWLREERGGERPDGPHTFTMLRDGRVLVYGMSARLSQLLCHGVSDEGVWWGANSPLFADGLQCSQEGLWQMAAVARGVSNWHLNGLTKCNLTTEATKPELCALLRRAETDYSWKFWYDLAAVYPKEVATYGAGLAVGTSIAAAIVGLGGWAIQKRTPALSYSEAVVTCAIAVRTFARIGAVSTICVIRSRR